MPYTYTIHPSERYAVLIAEGECDLDQTIVAMTGIARDPRFGPGFGVLADARGIDYAPRSDETRRLATLAAQRDLMLNHPIAIVASGDLNYGIGRMFSALVALQGGTAEVFRDLDGARSWLRKAVAAGPLRDPSGENE
jgi:hypothetical protein